MATEFNDASHWGFFMTGTTLTSSTGKYTRVSELVLAGLRAQGVFDNMVDGITAPTIDKLWLDKNSDPAVLKEWDATGSAWVPMNFERLFGRAIVTPMAAPTGTADALVVAEPEPFIRNRMYSLTPVADNAGAATIQVTGVGTYAVKYTDGTDIAAQEFKAGNPTILLFTGSRFEVVFKIADIYEVRDQLSEIAAQLPPLDSSTMLVDNAAGTARENKSFGEVRFLLEQSLSSGMDDGATSSANATALAAALATSASSGLPVQPAVGTIPLAVNSVGEVPSGASIVGLGPYRTTIERDGSNPGLNVDDGANVTLSGFTLDMNYSDGAVSGHAIRTEGANNLTVENVRLLDFAWDGVDAAGGTGVLVAAVDDATRPQNPRLRDLHLEANNTGEQAFGWIFDRTDNGFVRDVYSKGAVGNALGTGMAHELKNIARYSIMAGLNAEASSIGLGFGQESAGSFDGATNNIFMSLLAHGCDAGFVSSKGQQNLGVGLMYTLDTGKPNTRTKYAMQFDNDSRSNAVFASFASSTVDAVADFEDGARYNYAQFYSTVTGNVAKFQTGTTRNVVDVVHPGATESSILGLISDTSGSSTRGSAANVVYSAATGERVGSLSGTYHDKLEESGAAWNVAHYWRTEALNNVIHAMGHNGTSGNLAGWQVSVPGDANRAGWWHVLGATVDDDRWAVRGWGQSEVFGFTKAAFLPTRDATDAQSRGKALGSSTQRFTWGYMMNVSLFPAASVTPTVNGEMTFQLTSNTSLAIKVKGSDGVVRTASLTLA
ncbi:hypothetical protein [Sinorhizobium meliloti]|uniref:hypothetical protein n=1 Tax=Rhizobium meliloti TaxID=382 RepID=UPI00299E6EDC|nr:hypothetical protein [Sinorhizobium meliloti]